MLNKRIHILWFHLSDIQEEVKTNFRCLTKNLNHDCLDRGMDGGVIGKDHGELFWGAGSVPYLNLVDFSSGTYICQNILNEHLRSMPFTVDKLYLSKDKRQKSKPRICILKKYFKMHVS